MAVPSNKKIAAAKGAKAIREDQAGAKAIPGRVTSIDFEQFNTPTAQAIVNEAIPPATAPIEPPGVDAALTANAILRDKVAAAEDRPIDTGDNPNWGEPPAAQKSLETSAAAAKGRKALETGRTMNTSFGRNDRSTGFQNVSKGPGRVFTPADMGQVSPLDAMRQIIYEQGQAQGLLAGERAIRENQIATQARLNPMQQLIGPQLSQTEIGRAIAEQVQQGTPPREVISPAAADPIQDLQRRFWDLSAANGWSRRPTAEMIQISREIDKQRSQQRSKRQASLNATPGTPEADQRLSPPAIPVSRYATPGTPEADRAAAAAAAAGGMGAAGGGEGGGDGRVPPPRNPNDFDPNRPNRPEPPVLPVARLAGEVQLQPGLLNHFKAGWRAQAGDQNYSDSVIGDTFRGRKFPEQANSLTADKALYLGGRVGADVVGYGTRKGFWNMNPEDALGTLAREAANWAGLNGREAQLARYVTASTVGLASANYNPFNFGEGGRPTGFSAVNPTDDDPRKTDNPIGELLFDRGMLGRTGRLLPWQEFHQERPDVPYEKYAKYQDYIRGPSFLGLAKGTMDGIDGPEARIVGYRVQPEAILAAAAAGAATIAAFKYGGKRL